VSDDYQQKIQNFNAEVRKLFGLFFDEGFEDSEGTAEFICAVMVRGPEPELHVGIARSQMDAHDDLFLSRAIYRDACERADTDLSDEEKEDIIRHEAIGEMKKTGGKKKGGVN